MKNNRDRREVHWSVGLMSINPERIIFDKGIIEDANYDEKESLLSLNVRGIEDGLERTIDYTFSGLDVPESVEWLNMEPQMGYIDTSRRPVAIQRIYDDFGVESCSELIGSNVIGLYFSDRLVGIKNNEEYLIN